jgi:hypothetical protein
VWAGLTRRRCVPPRGVLYCVACVLGSLQTAGAAVQMTAMSKSFVPMRNVSLDATIPAGRYILIPTMFKAGTTEVPYFVEIHSDKPVTYASCRGGGARAGRRGGDARVRWWCRYDITGDALPDIDNNKVAKVVRAEGKVCVLASCVRA